MPVGNDGSWSKGGSDLKNKNVTMENLVNK